MITGALSSIMTFVLIGILFIVIYLKFDDLTALAGGGPSQTVYHVCRYCGANFKVETKRLPRNTTGVVAAKQVHGACKRCAGQQVLKRVGRVYLCKTCGFVLADESETLIMTRAAAEKRRLEQIKAEDCEECQRTKRLLRRYGNWDAEAARLVARGEMAVGMTEQQALASWGEPLSTENMAGSADKGEMQRWIFGDPVLKIPLRDRFVLISNGKVVYYEDAAQKRARPDDHIEFPNTIKTGEK